MHEQLLGQGHGLGRVVLCKTEVAQATKVLLGGGGAD